VAVKVVHVSDLTGQEGDENEFGQLEVRHPDFRDPIRLEVLPSEVEGLLDAAARVVQVNYTAPGDRSPRQLFVLVDDFNAAAGDRDMKTILMEAVATAQPERGRAAGDGRRATRAGGTTRGKVNYASLEHAGEPHRGRITDAEKELVRNNLKAVNERLARESKRTIDPKDPAMRERYGLKG
jgi:hypothetical protein